MFRKIIIGLICLFLLCFTACSAIQEKTDNKVSLANNYAYKFIESEFEAYLKSNNINEYFITQTLWGSDQFEKAYRFINDTGNIMTWGCKVRLNSFAKTGTRSSEMLDFEIMEEGEPFAEQLFAEELLRSEASLIDPSIDKDGYISLKFPSGWSWVSVGEYFRTHKETDTLAGNTALKEYIRSYWTDTLNSSLPQEASLETPVQDCQVNDDFSVSLRIKTEVPAHFLENNQVNLTELIRKHEETNIDGIYKIEYTSDLREMNLFVDRSYVENKLKKSGEHRIEEPLFLRLMIRHQVWQGVSPENLYAKININDKDTGELISTEILTGNIWLED